MNQPEQIPALSYHKFRSVDGKLHDSDPLILEIFEEYWRQRKPEEIGHA